MANRTLEGARDAQDRYDTAAAASAMAAAIRAAGLDPASFDLGKLGNEAVGLPSQDHQRRTSQPGGSGRDVGDVAPIDTHDKTHSPQPVGSTATPEQPRLHGPSPVDPRASAPADEPEEGDGREPPEPREPGEPPRSEHHESTRPKQPERPAEHREPSSAERPKVPGPGGDPPRPEVSDGPEGPRLNPHIAVGDPGTGPDDPWDQPTTAPTPIRTSVGPGGRPPPDEQGHAPPPRIPAGPIAAVLANLPAADREVRLGNLVRSLTRP